MPRIQHTQGPYPSTILSLSPQERFVSERANIDAITVLPPTPAPAANPAPARFLLSGERRSILPGRDPVPYISSPYTLGDISPALLPARLHPLLTQVLQGYINPSAPAPTPHLSPAPSFSTGPSQSLSGHRHTAGGRT